MKTLAELNSKWYWRLIKVLYSFLAILVIGWSIAWIYMEFWTYNPSNIAKIGEKIEDTNARFERMKNYIEWLHWNYSSWNIWWYSSGWVLNPGVILYIYSKEKSPIVEWTYLVCENESESECSYKQVDDSLYWKYIKWWTEVPVPKYDIEGFSDFMKRFFELKDVFNDFKKYGYWYEFISKYNSFFWEEISTYKDYRWLKEWGFIIISSLWVLLWVALFTYIIRSILFYIILWRAFPKDI